MFKSPDKDWGSRLPLIPTQVFDFEHQLSIFFAQITAPSSTEAIYIALSSRILDY